MAAFYTTAPVGQYRELVSGKTVTRSGIIVTGLGVLKRGQILGRAVSGKYDITTLPPLAILTVDVDTTAGDVQAPVHVQGWFKNNAVTVMTAQTLAAQSELLRDVGIFLETVEESTGMIIRSVEQAEIEQMENPPADPAPAVAPKYEGNILSLIHI